MVGCRLQLGHSQHQRSHGQQEKRGRRADRVVVGAQVGDDGTYEEQGEADCGGRPDQWYSDEADEQSERARCFEDTQMGSHDSGTLTLAAVMMTNLRRMKSAVAAKVLAAMAARVTTT